MPASLTGNVAFDWEAIWITLTSFFNVEECSGPPIPRSLAGLAGTAIFSPTEASPPPAREIPWEREGALQIFNHTIANELDPLGMNDSQASTGMLRSLRWQNLIGPGPEAGNTVN